MPIPEILNDLIVKGRACIRRLKVKTIWADEYLNLPSACNPATTVVSETSFGQAPIVGVGVKYARDDHSHGSPPAPSIPAAGNTVVNEQTYGQAANPGASSDYSRKDHTHGTVPSVAVPSPGDTVATEQAFGQASGAGVSSDYSRKDHTHGTPPTSALPSLQTSFSVAALVINVLAFPGVSVGSVVAPSNGRATAIIVYVHINNVSGGKRLYTARLLRNGVELNVNDRPRSEITAGDQIIIAYHFVDTAPPTPGPNTYDVEMISSSNNVNQTSNIRRVTVLAG